MVKLILAAILLADALACARMVDAHNAIEAARTADAILEDFTDSGVGCVFDCLAPAEVE